MQARPAASRIIALAGEAAARTGLSLWAVEDHTGKRGGVLRVFVDREGGVGIDDCAAMSRLLSALLDAEEAGAGHPWHLEVSSPGLDRKLTEPEHFRRCQGAAVALERRAPGPDGARRLTGVIEAASASGCTLVRDDGMRLELAYEDIRTARVIPPPPARGKKKEKS